MNAMPMLRPLPSLQPGNKGSKIILVVDDYAPIRDYLGRYLSEAGYQVLAASGAEEALRIAQSQGGTEVDLLLTDMEMPGMTGEALTEWFARERPGTRILLMSGLPESLESGAGRAILEKPFSMDVLSAAVRNALGEVFALTLHDNAVAAASSGQAA
jgi:DNA-binding response OmpR family regulator